MPPFVRVIYRFVVRGPNPCSLFLPRIHSLRSRAHSRRCKEAAPPPNPPPPDVQVVNVIKRDVPVYMEGIGVTRGDAEVEIRA